MNLGVATRGDSAEQRGTSCWLSPHGYRMGSHYQAPGGWGLHRGQLRAASTITTECLGFPHPAQAENTHIGRLRRAGVEPYPAVGRAGGQRHFLAYRELPKL